MSESSNKENALDIFKRLRGDEINRDILETQNNSINVTADEHQLNLALYNKTNPTDSGNVIYFVKNGMGKWVAVNLDVENKFGKSNVKTLTLVKCNGILVRQLDINVDIVVYDATGARLSFIPSLVKRRIYMYVNLRYAKKDSLFSKKINTIVNPETRETYIDRTASEFIDYVIRTSPNVQVANNNNSDIPEKTQLDNQYLKPPAPTTEEPVTENTQNNEYTPSPTFNTVPPQVTYVTTNYQTVTYNSNVGGDVNLGTQETTNIQNTNYEPPSWPDESRYRVQPNNENIQEEDLSSWEAKFGPQTFEEELINTLQNMQDNINEIQQGAEPQPINFDIENVLVKGDIPDLNPNPQIYDPELGIIRDMVPGDYDVLGGEPTFNVGQYGIYLPAYLTNKWAILGITSAVIVGSFTYLLYLNPQYGESIKNKISSITTSFIDLLRPTTPGQPYKLVKLSPDSDVRVEAVVRNHQELIDLYVQYILVDQNLNIQEHSLVDPLLKNMVVDTVSYKSDDYGETATFINMSETLIRDVNNKSEPFNEFIKDASIIAGSAPILIPTSDFGSEPQPLPVDVETALIDDTNKESWLSYLWGILGFLGSKVIDLLTAGLGGALSFLGNSTVWLLGLGAAAIAYFTMRK